MALNASAGAAAVAARLAPLSASALAGMAAGLVRTAETSGDRLPEDARHRTGMRLIATDRYDVWLLRWPPGTSVEPHDHGASIGVFAVVTGELLEVRWTQGLRRSRLVVPGEVVTIERGVVHDVVAPTVPSLSVHLYSPPLTTMSFYDEFGQEAMRRSPVDDAAPALATARSLHPAGSC
jgi:quercetin dioxygenase-like cupin family protein